jgi:CheY-like chemotaxis protein
MNKPLRCIMLVDDDTNDNYYHKREIGKANQSITVIEKQTGLEALEYLVINQQNKDLLPDLILLDINMPVMDGWQFLKAYTEMVKGLKDSLIIIMLSTSGDPDDFEKAKRFSCVYDFITKPLTRDIIRNIANKYFSEAVV